MKIEIIEHNGYLFEDDMPTLVILQINGKQMIPYPAEKTLREMYSDILMMKHPLCSPKASDKQVVKALQSGEIGIVDFNKSKVIERNDIIECIKAQGEESEVVVGKKYCVMEVIKSNGVVVGYDIINAEVGDNIRTQILAEDVKLVEKFIPPPPRKEFFEMIKKCICGQDVVLALEGDEYKGKCEKCEAQLIEIKGVKV